MLEQVGIKNFQSLRDIRLQLDPFTVIVGRSSTGKSALTRALRALTSNTRGTAFITHGERTAVITAQTERGTVSLSRGGTDSYTIIPANGETQTFTKLGGAVPDEVTAFIGIPAKDPLNYANQFDMPYLLTASAAEVARTLGDLTGVSIIFEAAREANRRRLAHSSTLRTRATDLKEITDRIDEFKNLPAQLAAQAEVEELITAAAQLEWTRGAITKNVEEIEEQTSVIDNLPAPIDIPDISQLEVLAADRHYLWNLIAAIEQLESRIKNFRTDRDIPDSSTLGDLAARRSLLAHTLTDAQEAATQYRAAVQSHDEATRALAAAQEDYTATIVSLGTCPTCGQSTKALAHADH